LSTTRRQFITGSLAFGAAALLASCGDKDSGSDPGNTTNYPWAYKSLDAAAAAQRGYDIFWERHCMAGPFEAIVAALGDQLGEPYSSFPFEMFKAGAGGLQVSSVCGTCNGSAMAIGLFVEDGAARSALISELFNWYEQTALPIFVPPNPHVDTTIAQSTPHSTLCHASVSKWCDSSGLSAYSSERSERCARLVADVTGKLVELLNAHFAGTFSAAYPMTATTESCRSCHDKGGMLENTRGKMECTSCHDEHSI